MRQFATITVIGRDKTGAITPSLSFCFGQKAKIKALEEQVTRSQRLGAGVLVKAVKLYPGKRLDVHCGVVKKV